MRTPLARSRTVVVACFVIVAASCGGAGASSAPSAQASAADQPTLLWPAPSDPLERTVEAGLEPAEKEFLVNHAHSHLDVFVDGEAILVPAGIGINIEDPEPFNAALFDFFMRADQGRVTPRDPRSLASGILGYKK